MNAKEFLKDVYEKELMSGSPIPQDEWMEMLEDDSWLNLTLKAMEAYHWHRVEPAIKTLNELTQMSDPGDYGLAVVELKRLGHIALDQLKADQ